VKETVFTQKHIELGAKMAPFAGFNMPIEYSGLIKEHTAVREGVGIFDVSHMGEIWVFGPNAKALLQYITTNDINALYPGRAQYTCMPNGRGGIVDDLIVYCFSETEYLLGVNAANTDKDWNHICSFADKFGMKVDKDLVNTSDDTCQLAIQGPKAMEVMQKLCDEDIMSMHTYTFKQLTVAGFEHVLLATTGYTGSGGCEVYTINAEGPKLWDAIMKAGEPYGIVPVGLGARDTLRLEKGYLLYGNDMDDTTSPLEAGLGWITKFNDEKGDFVDRDFLLRQKAEGLKRKLVAFELVDKGIARHGYPICDAQGREIGHVTSGTMGPTVKKAIGLGYVEAPLFALGSEIYINVRGRLLKAQVVKAPFC
jgi:aminomethyltransferase